ncbi:MAG: DEAD/DEAH box helicase [Phycisphaeraceae bacterium]
MSMIETWSPYFDSQVRMRGRAYQSDGRVKLVEPRRGELARARVRGTRTYTVTIRGEGPAANVACTCPHFRDGFYCKHIWATLLEVQQAVAGDPNPHAINRVSPSPPKARKRKADRKPSRQAEPDWIGRLSLLRPVGFAPKDQGPVGLPNQRRVCYVVSPEPSRQHNGLVVEVRQCQPTATGWGRLKRFKINTETVAELSDPIDRELCALILGATWVDAYDNGEFYRSDRLHSAYRLPPGAWRTLLRRMIQTGRCYVHDEESGEVVLSWDAPDNQPWVLWLVGTKTDDGLNINVEFRRGSQRMSVDRPQLVLGGDDAVLIYDDKAAPLDDRDAFRWAVQFRDEQPCRDESATMHVPREDVPRFLDRLYLLPNLPEIDLPDGIGRTEQRVEPVPHMELFSGGLRQTQPGGTAASRHLTAKVWFAYRHHRVTPGQRSRFVGGLPTGADVTERDANAAVADPDEDAHTELIRRDHRREQELLASLVTIGFRHNPINGADPDAFAVLPVRLMPQAIDELIRRGWVVLADHKAIRNPGTPSFSVTSGVDWFELRGGIRYQAGDSEQVISLPEILAAARSGQAMITLSDGSKGLLPQQWLQQHGLITALGKVQGDHIRFKTSQAAILDALLARQQQIDVDAQFALARQRLREFDGVDPLDPSATFCGTLRHYQRDGLGWLVFLRRFGMGGILADDMGLGKTVQVLAMLDTHYGQNRALEDRRPVDEGETGANTDRPGHPTLIVVPRSVVFNWIDEAKRFAPNLRVQVYAGADRHEHRDAFADHDVIITSYGLMRRDIAELRKHRFEYVVLDEAQAIKNPASQSAKAARLLDTSYRLALTGTPVENHLGDLWSIFEFLNPGMLGANARFAKLIRNGLQPRLGKPNGTRNGMTSHQVAAQVAQVLRPFILRRTKQQVLDELPEKTEQTILCEMEPAQRKVYDQLRSYYRGSLLRQVDARAQAKLGRSSMMVLEALLRLRQAACHPALIDRKRADEPSAKLQVLLDRLRDLIEEGHKALVFSQFTSMLALVRARLDEHDIPYEYLDGRTRNRRRVVERFQTDPDCPVFLISLKAGGLGLNLTAAEYVFILDPWWNPAVEQQAIDRAHRIGQTRHVFAYRLICEDTVEQRIAELQIKKKKLADAIVGGQKNLLRGLTRHDLERLLS